MQNILSRWNKHCRIIWDLYLQTAEQLGNEFSYLTYVSSMMNRNYSSVGIKKLTWKDEWLLRVSILSQRKLRLKFG